VESEHIRFESKEREDADDESSNAHFQDDEDGSRKERIQSIQVRHMQELEGSQQLVKLRKEIASALKHSLTRSHDKNACQLESDLRELQEKADSL